MSGWEDTSSMKAALPEVAAPTGDAGDQKHEWGEREVYDYDAFGNRDREWDGNARVYEWDGEQGDVGPEMPELEAQLFGPPDERDSGGIDFSKIDTINVLQEGLVRIQPVARFEDSGLHPIMLNNVKLCGYRKPTPIQRYCIPAIKLGYDMIAIAQTGSGKTAAYLIPILDHLMGKARKLAAPRPSAAEIASGTATPVRAEPLVVIVCPARELAVQIFNEARKFCYRTMLRPCVVYGGGPIPEQIAQLQRGCDILIASPGRLIDFMERPHLLTLRRVKYMVIDEADEMLHSDWEEEFNKILSGGEQEEGNIKYMLFSATFPTAVRKLAKHHLAESHVRIHVGRIGSAHENIKQDIIFTDPSMKRQALVDLLCAMPPARTIIFVNVKAVADELDDFLFNQHSMPCTSMHSDRTQREREDAMRAFRSGKAPILITTGVTARGIDVRNVMHVINYDLPRVDHGGITEYTHRIGRTGRIGHRGMASSFYTERDEPLAELLTLTLLETGQEIPEFLQSYVPEDKSNLKFEPGSDEEDEQEQGGGGDGWGSEAPKAADSNGGGGGGDGWGAPQNELPKSDVQKESNGWGAGPSSAAAPANNDGWAGSGGGW